MAKFHSDEEEWGYTNYNALNRFPNLDGIEPKIVEHLIKSTSKYAEIFWKILKYDDLHALSKPSLDRQERLKLVNNDNGESNEKRLFIVTSTEELFKAIWELLSNIKHKLIASINSLIIL